MKTIQEALDAFLAAKEEALAERTLEWYRYEVGRFIEWLEDNAIGDWYRPEVVERHLVDLRQTRPSAFSVDGRYRALRAWVGWLVERGHLERNVFDRVSRPKRPKKLAKHATAEEVRILLEHLDPTECPANWTALRDRAMLQILFYSGLRVGELTALELEDVNLGRRLLRIRHGKGDRERLTPITEDTRDALASYLLCRPAGNMPEVFLGNDGAGGVRGPLTDEGVRQRIRRLCKLAGVRHLNPHSFRHGTAVHMLNERGADMALVSKVLGHDSLTTTARFYAAWSVEGMQNAYDSVMGMD